MRRPAISAFLAALVLAAAPARAAGDDEDWRMLGNVLALVQQFVRAAAESPDPDAARRKLDEVLEGRSPEANRAAGEILAELLAEMPAGHRGTFTSIARDLLVLARRESARAPAQAEREEALRARKELHAMGLRYWDEQQYQEAVKRGDRIAVELFLAARGLPGKPAARSPQEAR
jgi:hypothetical protein